MAITFNAKTGAAVEEAATVRETVRGYWINAFADAETGATLNVDAETPAGQIIDTETALVVQKDTDLLYLANMFNPRTSEGKWQDALGMIYFLERKVAQSTVVQCQCVGLQGTEIPTGSVVQNTDGYRLVSLETATIPSSGTVNISFECEETGAIEIGANTVTKIITVIPGWDTVNNSAAGVVGWDEESRAEFEHRRYNSVAYNSHGSIYSIYSAIANVDGVLSVAVVENNTNEDMEISGVTVPGHSICASVYGGEDEDIAEALYRKLDAGCGTCGGTEVSYQDPEFNNATYTYEILRPEVIPVKIQVYIVETVSTPASIVEDIRTAVFNDFYGQLDNTRVGLGATIYASRFYPCIFDAGVEKLVGVQISKGDGDLSYMAEFLIGEQPTLQTDDITVTVVQED